MYNKNSYQQHYLNNPQFSPSPTIQYSRSNDSVLDLNGNEILLHNHHHGAHNLFNNHYLAANNAPFLEAAALFNNLNQELEIPNEDPVSMTDPKKQNVARKDRHSKIYTSQGPRDRRVRLSIGIARKFFDLQELLDFDKPSKTLDWLLSKSKAAIKELVQSKTLSSPTSESEEVLSNGNSLGVVPDLKGKSVANKCKVSSSLNFAKESRAKARARARERTKEKMCIKQLNEATRNLLEVSGSREAGIHHYPVTCFGATDQDLIEEIKRKLMKQQNWDYSNFVDQSNELCSILDQHKFIN